MFCQDDEVNPGRETSRGFAFEARMKLAAILMAIIAVSQPAIAYGRHHGHYGHSSWWGPVIIGGSVIGGVMIASAITEARATPAAMRRCAIEFPSFEARSGTYVNEGGAVRICPYLY